MRLPGPVSLLLLFAGAACGGGSAEFSSPREVTKDQRPTQWDAPTKDRLLLPDMSAPKAAAAASQWTATVPAGWEELPAQPERFRDRIWRVAGDASTECYLTARVGGGVAQNLARWYGQFGSSETKPPESLPLVELGGRPARLLELQGSYQGKAGQAMLLAFAAEGSQVTTLKFTGPQAVVAAHKEAFLALAKSLREVAGGSAPAAAPAAPPAAAPTPAAPTPAAATPPAAAGPFQADVPAGWTPKPGASKPLHHTFADDGEVYVSQMGGAMRQMLDVWRGELSLPALDDAAFAALPKVPMLGGEAVLLDVTGNWRGMGGKQLDGARLLVAAHLEGGTMTFAKLVAKDAAAAAQREAFLAFCKSLRRNP